MEASEQELEEEQPLGEGAVLVAPQPAAQPQEAHGEAGAGQLSVLWRRPPAAARAPVAAGAAAGLCRLGTLCHGR